MIPVSVISHDNYLQELSCLGSPKIHYLSAVRVLESDVYRRFYAAKGESGALLCLDNGVAERGRSVGPGSLAKAAQLVQAGEVVLPDILRDGVATCCATEAAAIELARLKDSGMAFCGVLQGRDADDWRRSVDWMHTQSFIDTVALPYRTPPLSTSDRGNARLAATAYLDSNGYIHEGREYHLLGFSDSGHMELAAQCRHSWIRSADTVAPIALASRGSRVQPSEPYSKVSVPVAELGQLSRDALSLAKENIRVFCQCASSPLNRTEV